MKTFNVLFTITDKGSRYSEIASGMIEVCAATSAFAKAKASQLAARGFVGVHVETKAFEIINPLPRKGCTLE